MRFSVIIPVYKAENTIVRCIESLLSQKYADAEILLVNDGSPDPSGTICRKYAQQYENIRYFEKQNGGASSARNFGLDHATGEYILFVDSDDYVTKDYFAVLHAQAALQEDFLLFTYQRLKKNGAVPYPHSASLLNAKSTFDALHQIVEQRDCAPCNKCFKRRILQAHQIRFPEDLYIGEDFIFSLSYLLHCETVRVINDCIYCVDESNCDSLSRARQKDRHLQALRIYQYAFSLAKCSALPEAEKKTLEQTLDYNYCRTAFACVRYEISHEGKRYRENCQIIRKILMAFKHDRTAWSQPKSCVHIFMRIVIVWELTFLAYLVARQ